MDLQPEFKLIKAARVIDSVAEHPIEKGAVLVEGSRIIQVGTAEEVAAPEGASVQEYDYPTGTLLPGLIDIHCHFNYMGDGVHTDDVMSMPDDILLMRSLVGARTHLESGVTTARETGAKHDTTFSMREGIRQGLAKGPRLVLCGNPITITGGHMWQMGAEADGVDEVRAAVRRLVKKGADWIKVPATGGSTSSSFVLRPSYTVEELRAICDEAHNFGLPVGAHCRNTAGMINCLDAGVDMIIHVWFLEPDGTFNFRHDVAERIARQGAVINSTLQVARSRAWTLLERPEWVGRSPADISEDLRRELETDLRNSEMQFEHTRLLHDMGVTLIPGTDSGFGWYPFGKFGYELECLTDVGFTPMRAIRGATRGGAEAIGVSDIVGTLETGKEADLLVVEGDAAVDIKAIRDVLAVFQGGAQVR